MWTDWRDAVAWAANEWAPGQIEQDDLWWKLHQDFKAYMLSTYLLRDDIYLDGWLLKAVNTNMPRVQEWALNWMINHGYGQSGYYTK